MARFHDLATFFFLRRFFKDERQTCSALRSNGAAPSAGAKWGAMEQLCAGCRMMGPWVYSPQITHYAQATTAS